ncbi:MAG: organomercurial lyase [Actinomycetota bacterium]
MTETSAGGCPSNDLDRAVAAFRRQAFAALLIGARPRIADIVETASQDGLDVAPAVAWLEAHGQLERDGELLVGAHGLTRRATPHLLTIGGRTLHTWCAYDAIAIPVVLQATARAETSCPTCQRLLVVDIDAGHLPVTPGPVLWTPTGPCERVIDDFCAHANLFCTSGHLDTWRHGAGNPSGQPTTLSEVPALAKVSWADVATQS